MAKRTRSGTGAEITFHDAAQALHGALAGGARAEILDRLLRSEDLREALKRLRIGMRTHTFRPASGRLDLSVVVEQIDGRNRRDGFRVLHAWDPEAHRFTAESNPVLLLDYVARAGVAARPVPGALAILLDCYFLYLLALLAMRSPFEGDPDAALERVTGLIGELQGPNGSGHQFVADAETLLLLAISQYQPDETAYDRLLLRVRDLGESHRERLARVGAANLGSHLRWGYRFMYRTDPERMRADNVVDYPWLLFCLATLMREYARMREGGEHGDARTDVVEALLNGLTADPWAFVGEPPACLAEHGAEHAYLRDSLRRVRDDLLREFEALRPSSRSYSPLAFDFNFLHNTLVAKLVTALLRGTGPNLTLNELFTRERPGISLVSSPEVLARLLMDYAGSEPARRGSRGAVLTVYDPAAAARSFDTAVEVIGGME